MTRRGATRPGGVALACAALLSAVAACDALPELRVERVSVAETDEAARLAAAGVSTEELRTTVAHALDRHAGGWWAGLFHRERATFAQLVVRDATVALPAGEAPSARVAVVVELARAGAPSWREAADGVAVVGAEPGSLGRAFGRAARGAAERAVRGLALSLRADRASTRELLAQLHDPDPFVRLHAVSALAARRDAEALPAVASALSDPDEEVSERAVGALAELRDPRAVPALIDRARRRDPEYVAGVARILGDLGGAEARAWLVTAADGHPDPIVREAAREALAQLERRSTSNAPGPRPP